jgi:hypothetical protein
LLRQVDGLASQRKPVAELIHAKGVTALKHYCWRRQYAGLKSDQIE